MKRTSKPLRFIRRHRIVVIVVAATLALAGIYTFWSVNTWGNYTATYERWRTSLQTDVDTAIALPASNDEERAKKIDALTRITEDIHAHNESLCRVETLLRWQEVIRGAKEKQEACQEFTQKAVKFGAELQELTGYLKNDQVLAEIMKKAGAEETLTEDDLESQVQAWQQALREVQDMSAEVAFRPVKEIAVQSTTTIYEAWQKLYDAHKAQDSAAYDEARGSIADAYDTIATVTSESDRRFTTLADSLQTTYAATF